MPWLCLFFKRMIFKQRLAVGCARAFGRPLFMTMCLAGTGCPHEGETLATKHLPESSSGEQENIPKMLLMGCLGPELRNHLQEENPLPATPCLVFFCSGLKNFFLRKIPGVIIHFFSRWRKVQFCSVGSCEDTGLVLQLNLLGGQSDLQPVALDLPRSVQERENNQSMFS